MKSFVVNTTINFEGSKFYVRPGDVLSYDVHHGNSLAVYRNGKIVKVLQVKPFVMEAFTKSKFISEVRQQPTPLQGFGILSKEQATTVAKKVNVPHLLTKAQANAYPSDVGVAVVEGELQAKAFNDLGNSPASQADMDSLARQHDELMEPTPKSDKKKKKPQDVAV